jgi:hypothetical protein
MSAPRNHQSEPYGSSPVLVGRNPVLVNAIAAMYTDSHAASSGGTPSRSMRGKMRMATKSSITSTLIATVASRLRVSPSRTAWLSETGPLRMRSGFASPAAMSFCRRPSLRLMMRPRIDATVSTPMPPTSTPTKTKM